MNIMNMMTEIKKNKKRLRGVIVSDKMNKTRVVLVSRFVKHGRYQKYVKIGKHYKAHDEKNEYQTGNKVIIEECRPLSKDKKFKIVAKI